MMQRLTQWLGLAEQQSPADQLDYGVIESFMKGASIPKLSAPAGQAMIERQREIEQSVREYLDRQERMIQELESQVAELIRQGNRNDQ